MLLARESTPRRVCVFGNSAKTKPESRRCRTSSANARKELLAALGLTILVFGFLLLIFLATFDKRLGPTPASPWVIRLGPFVSSVMPGTFVVRVLRFSAMPCGPLFIGFSQATWKMCSPRLPTMPIASCLK